MSVISQLAVSTEEEESQLVATVVQLFSCQASGGWGVEGGVLARGWRISVGAIVRNRVAGS